MGLSPVSGGTMPDGDTTSGWAYPFVLAAMNAKMVQGNGSGYINANNNVIRAEVIAMAARSLGLADGDAGILSGFSDGGSVPDWCKGNMAAMIEKKIITGFEDKTLKPGILITRAELFAIAYRMINNQ